MTGQIYQSLGAYYYYYYYSSNRIIVLDGSHIDFLLSFL